MGKELSTLKKLPNIKAMCKTKWEAFCLHSAATLSVRTKLCHSEVSLSFKRNRGFYRRAVKQPELPVKKMKKNKNKKHTTKTEIVNLES